MHESDQLWLNSVPEAALLSLEITEIIVIGLHIPCAWNAMLF